MSETASTKPYLIRALYEWCTDNGYTPHIAVKVQGQVRVPMEFVRNGDIVLNIAFSACSGLQMDNLAISFKARFGGVSRDIYVPIEAIAAIYASENGQGMAFEVSSELVNKEIAPSPVTEKPAMTLAITNTDDSSAKTETNLKEIRKKPSLTIIK
ncbi:ClpXP protease specificity-enhancing factor [Solimicrobium silvestre]|uniref:Stringent starvation protein B n=1 Tax=Solimicrobium silvestre TaxID=2099400 RepID=A0A2S9H201_9BURK|nr:ClpXP protease specificity-enhancing factor [Solimicrobium silvestre]PRC93987.1 Stringent starvation protein B [Solimicrobium silvestre]